MDATACDRRDVARRDRRARLEWVAIGSLSDPDRAPRSFLDRDLEAAVVRHLVGVGCHHPADLEALVAGVLGWTDMGQDMLRTWQDPVMGRRAVGIPPPGTWSPDLATDGRRWAVPGWARSHDAFHRDLVPLLVPYTARVADPGLPQRYADWLGCGSAHLPGHPWWSCCFAHPWKKAAAFLLAWVGLEPAPAGAGPWA